MTNIAEPTEATNLIGMLVQAAREREAATRVPDCIASAQQRLDQAKDAVLAAMRSAPQEPDDARGLLSSLQAFVAEHQRGVPFNEDRQGTATILIAEAAYRIAELESDGTKVQGE